MKKSKATAKKAIKSLNPKQYLKLTLVVALAGFLFATVTSVASYPSEAHRNVVKDKSELSSKLFNVTDYESKEAKDLENKLDSLNETPQSKYTGNVQLFLGTLGSLFFTFAVVGVTYFYIRRHTSQRKLVSVTINSAVNLVAFMLALLPWFIVDWMLQGRPDLISGFGSVNEGTAALAVAALLIFFLPLLLVLLSLMYMFMSLIFAGYEWYANANKSVTRKNHSRNAN